ncbi:hypothetical protein FUU19_13010 [Serratia sp. Lou2A]|nr:hypothetical protein [Serratia sp. Lou2A]MCC7658361.1 hypothetical protein [Serratia sp. Pon4B]
MAEEIKKARRLAR